MNVLKEITDYFKKTGEDEFLIADVFGEFASEEIMSQIADLSLAGVISFTDDVTGGKIKLEKH